MPALAVGHGTAWLKTVPSPRLGRQDPPAPPPSRRKSIPAPQLSSGSSRSSRSSDPRYPLRRPQIPIDRASPTAEPRPPAVSSPEASRTPATRASRNLIVVAGVREPLYGVFVVKNICWADHVFSSYRFSGLRSRLPRPAAVEKTIRGGARFRARSPRTTLYSVAPGGAVP